MKSTTIQILQAIAKRHAERPFSYAPGKDDLLHEIQFQLYPCSFTEAMVHANAIRAGLIKAS